MKPHFGTEIKHSSIRQQSSAVIFITPAHHFSVSVQSLIMASVVHWEHATQKHLLMVVEWCNHKDGSWLYIVEDMQQAGRVSCLSLNRIPACCQYSSDLKEVGKLHPPHKSSVLKCVAHLMLRANCFQHQNSMIAGVCGQTHVLCNCFVILHFN